MSGTSADGVDAVLCRIGDNGTEVVDALCMPLPDSLRNALATIISRSESVLLKDMGELDRQLGLAFADAANELMRSNQLSAPDITAIGSHGQTVFHSPEGDNPFTWQAGDPNLIAARTGVLTVADFRRKDMALGGQGAPLVPAFHAAMFSKPGTERAILNIGGIANLTFLGKDDRVMGFDTGPGNCLMDIWVHRHQGLDFDARGAWAAGGQVDSELLASMLGHPFIKRAPPKSTGRELFNEAWLEGRLQSLVHRVGARDVQATLLEFTARSIELAVQQTLPNTELVGVCGGGVHNTALMERLAALRAGGRVCSTAELGLDPDWVEGAAFAWLAYRTVSGFTGNLPSVTGASKATVLGGIYQP
jgi:anhydro-N-acetylmuramic acid kinase